MTQFPVRETQPKKDRVGERVTMNRHPDLIVEIIGWDSEMGMWEAVEVTMRTYKTHLREDYLVQGEVLSKIQEIDPHAPEEL
jgi:hypothetical protein